MIILYILFFFLKILLYLLLFFLAVTVILLLVPVRYHALGAFGKEKSADVTVSWLLRLVQIQLQYKAGKSMFIFKLAGMRKQPGNKKEKSLKNKHSRGLPVSTQKNMPEAVHGKARDTAPEAADTAASKDIRKARHKAEEGTNEKKDRGINFGSIKTVLTYPDLKIIMDLIVRFLKKYVRVLIPKHIDINGVFGFKDPSATGLALGAYEAVAGIYNLRARIRLQGDFNRSGLEMQGTVSGSIRFCSLLWPLVWLLTRRPMFRLLIKYIKSSRKKTSGAKPDDTESRRDGLNEQ